MTTYSVAVTITSRGGATVYTPQVSQGDDVPGNVAAAYGLADPLTIRQSLTNDAKLPLSHPEPDEAGVALIAPNATTYADLAVGDPIGVQVYPSWAFAGTPVTFYGRVGAIQADPHKLGVQLSLDCVDYTADLAEYDVGLVNYPVETAAARLDRIMDEAGLPRLVLTGVITGTLASQLTAIISARSAGKTDAYSLIRDTLDAAGFVTFKDENGTTFTTTHPLSLIPRLVPVITNGQLDPVTPFAVRLGVPWTRRIAYAPPYRLTNVAGTYTVTVSDADSSPSTGAPTIKASRVTFAPSFSQTKSSGLPNVTIAVDAQGNRYTWDWRRVQSQWATGGGVYLGGQVIPYYSQGGVLQAPPVTQEIDSVIDVTDSGVTGQPAGIVQHYRTPFTPDNLTSWAIGTMRWNTWAEGATWRRPELTELLTVAGAQAGHLPNNREWVSGLVVGTTLTIEGGRHYLDVDVAPPSYDFVANRERLGATLGVISMDSPAQTGVTLAQVNARDTLNDYALVRGS